MMGVTRELFRAMIFYDFKTRISEAGSLERL
jgi:hypothetical protein